MVIQTLHRALWKKTGVVVRQSQGNEVVIQEDKDRVREQQVRGSVVVSKRVVA